jgi:hypothetical protein
MTEAEWMTTDDPLSMLEFLRGRRIGRHRRLFACACCRLIWDRLPSDAWRRAVEVAERFADGEASNEERSTAYRVAYGCAGGPFTPSAAGFACYADASYANARAAAAHVAFLDPSLLPRQAALLRELFGNPFRRRTINHSWIAWNDSAIRSMAQAIYDERAFDRLPILADALEDAGCDDADILAHCRSGGEHVRGCWVVDLLLGKE